MFIADLNKKQCMEIWSMINLHPVKIARRLFPDRPKRYVSATINIGSYCLNKGVALGIDDFEDAKKYIDICTRIWVYLPVWARYIPDKF